MPLRPPARGTRRFTSGLYYYSPIPENDGTGTPGQDSLVVSAFPVEAAFAIDRIGAEVTAGAVGATIRLGIYADTGRGAPGALLLDAGTIDGNDVSYQEITVALTLPEGLYWIGAASQGGDPTLRTKSEAEGMYMPQSSGATANRCSWVNGSVVGALPNPFTDTPTLGTIVAKVLLRAV